MRCRRFFDGNYLSVLIGIFRAYYEPVGVSLLAIAVFPVISI
jgi:hypothetical protein